MKRLGLLGIVAVVALGAGACSSSESTGTGGGAGGQRTGGAGGAAGGAGGGGPVCPANASITQDGVSHPYTVTAVVVGVDGCDTAVMEALNHDIAVKYVVAASPPTNDFQVGDLVGADPGEPTLGKGALNGATCRGELKRDNLVTPEAGTKCYHNVKVTSALALTGPDIFTLDVTETWSEFTAECGSDKTIKDEYPEVAAAAAKGTCTSTYKLTLKRAVSPADGGVKD